ncbi:Type 1 glutamine amidotransferase-like domain-containing protein [Ilumatobacter sp.]|uniref:Type 1 glutamine amidotransferase-like domain-containing protein n=1 Tax=Ilumatobacter sp. TaxID=1967498 RepID=UPI003B519E96
MAGLLCLQGGRELTSECEDMDRYVLHRSRARRVAVLAGAARVGSDYAQASERARRHYEALGASVSIVPDPRDDVGAAVAALADDIGLVVLPGGSPSSLLAVLTGELRARLTHLQHEGAAISGASAGAMVLCQRMARPDRDGEVVEALGLVEGMALPHWSPGSGAGGDSSTIAWGLPECGGVVIDGTSCVAVGRGTPSIRAGGRWRAIERDD